MLRFGGTGHCIDVGKLTSRDDPDERFAHMVQEHRQALTRYGVRRLSDHSAVEDLVAETFVAAYRHQTSLPPRDEEIYWLYAIARRVLANQVRGQTRSLRLESRLAFERETTLDEPRFSEDDLATLLNVLGELDPDDRELIQLAYWERLNYRGLGLVLGCSAKAAGMRLSRVRTTLRKLLRETPDGVISINQRRRENL